MRGKWPYRFTRKEMSNPEVTEGNGLGCDAGWLFILG